MGFKKKEFWIVLILFVLTGTLINLLRYSRVESKRLPLFSSLPLQFGDWNGQEYFFSDETNQVLKADTYAFRKYTSSEGKELWLFVAYFKSQKYGSQIHSPKNCLPGSGWKITSRKKILIKTDTGSDLKVNKLLISDKLSREVMYYWFQTRSGIITSELGLKLDLVLNSLKRAPTDAAFVRINLPLYQLSEKEAQLVLEDFLKVFHSRIKEVLPF
ncbi:MAG: EpsI family protein [candidate division Zixibacteria bacterium]|nr:EpsI family protein [candidate division Zixibacteria bacterium]